MAMQADGISVVGNTHVTNYVAQIDFTWTVPDGDIGIPPYGWYSIVLQRSEDNVTFSDSFFSSYTPDTAGSHMQSGDADLSDPTPHTVYYRLKTLFLYHAPAYSNVVSADVANIVTPTKTPASNLRGECSG